MNMKECDGLYRKFDLNEEMMASAVSAWTIPIRRRARQAKYTFTPVSSLAEQFEILRCLNSPVSEPTVLATGLPLNRRASLADVMLPRFTGAGKAGPLLCS